jgi:hypothetical protein
MEQASEFMLVVKAVSDQVAPELVERQIPSSAEAYAIAPLPERATLYQFVSGGPVACQVIPLSWDIQSSPGLAAASRTKPFVEQAIETHRLLGASLKYQLVPKLVE